MPKRKLNSQYAPSDSNIQEPSNEILCDASTISDIGNSTNIGQLYTNALNNTNDIVEPPITLFMGTTKYNISTKYNPIEIFNDYFTSVVNNVCGYIEECGYNVDQIKADASRILTHTFLSILYFNNIIIPSNISLYKHESNILLGECIYYNKNYEKNELHIHISTKLLVNFLNLDENFDIVFSNKINTEMCSIRDNFQQNKDSIVITKELYKILVDLFIIADHAATHYIEEYTTSNTDWIHHFNFGKVINTFTLINTIFKISANISNLDAIPKLTVDNKRGPNIEGIGSIDQLFINTNIAPINSVMNINNIVSDIF